MGGAALSSSDVRLHGQTSPSADLFMITSHSRHVRGLGASHVIWRKQTDLSSLMDSNQGHFYCYCKSGFLRPLAKSLPSFVFSLPAGKERFTIDLK